MMRARLKDKAIIVIGSGTGIGAATVKRLISEGAHVCAADINLESARKLCEEVTATGGHAFAVPIDVADEASVQAAIAEAVATLGKLDGAHINAADMQSIHSDTDALDEDLAVFDRMIQVNLRGHFLCTRAVLPHLKKSDAGAIVYTSSVSGQIGEPVRPAYGASKSGLNALMRHVASRWGREGITANCVAPGFVLTPEMTASGRVPDEVIQGFLASTPSPRVGNVDDIAGVVAMLLSDDGRWVNGQVVNVNGGSLMA